MNETEHRALWTRFAELLTSQDFDRLDDVYAADSVAEFPQSGERFRGIDKIRAQFRAYPAPEPMSTRVADVIGGTAYALTPMYTVIAVEGSGDRGTSIFQSRYPDGSLWWVINVYEVADGRVSRVRTFFAPVFEAPAWREPFWDKDKGGS
ncbi:MAG TPA: nuclear transport factor 2 family protein [Candidatus Limnocylindrales bacterium]